MSELLENSELIQKNDSFETLLDKLQVVDHELREETGGVVLFALFERDDAPGRWDVFVAADWVDPDTTSAVAYVAGKVQQRLTPDELVLLSGVVALPSSNPSVRHLLKGTIKVHGRNRFDECWLNDILIRRAWIFTADLDTRSHFRPPSYVPKHGCPGAKTQGGQKVVVGGRTHRRKR